MEFLTPHGKGPSCLCYLPDGQGRLITTGPDGDLAERQDSQLSESSVHVDTLLTHESSTCLAVTESTVVVAGDNTVKVGGWVGGGGACLRVEAFLK